MVAEKDPGQMNPNNVAKLILYIVVFVLSVGLYFILDFLTGLDPWVAVLIAAATDLVLLFLISIAWGYFRPEKPKTKDNDSSE